MTIITTASGRAGSVLLHGFSAREYGLQSGSLPEGSSHGPRSVTPTQKNSSKKCNHHLPVHLTSILSLIYLHYAVKLVTIAESARSDRAAWGNSISMASGGKVKKSKHSSSRKTIRSVRKIKDQHGSSVEESSDDDDFDDDDDEGDEEEDDDEEEDEDEEEEEEDDDEEEEEDDYEEEDEDEEEEDGDEEDEEEDDDEEEEEEEEDEDEDEDEEEEDDDDEEEEDGESSDSSTSSNSSGPQAAVARTGYPKTGGEFQFGGWHERLAPPQI